MKSTVSMVLPWLITRWSAPDSGYRSTDPPRSPSGRQSARLQATPLVTTTRLSARLLDSAQEVCASLRHGGRLMPRTVRLNRPPEAARGAVPLGVPLFVLSDPGLDVHEAPSLTTTLGPETAPRCPGDLRNAGTGVLTRPGIWVTYAVARAPHRGSACEDRDGSATWPPPVAPAQDERPLLSPLAGILSPPRRCPTRLRRGQVRAWPPSVGRLRLSPLRAAGQRRTRRGDRTRRQRLRRRPGTSPGPPRCRTRCTSCFSCVHETLDEESAVGPGGPDSRASGTSSSTERSARERR